jgi:hypothetical protein
MDYGQSERSQLFSARQEIARLTAALSTVTAERDRGGQEHTKTIEERDHREEQIERIAVSLGCQEEWTSCHDHGECAEEASAELMARAEKERDEAEALRECAQGVDEKGEPCWCCLPCMIPYRGHETGCLAARAALALPREEGPRCAACGGNWFNAVGGCVRCCLSAGAAAAYALTTAPPPPQPTEAVCLLCLRTEAQHGDPPHRFMSNLTPPQPTVVSVDGIEDRGIQYWGKATKQPNGKWHAYANIDGNLCVVECDITFTAPAAPSTKEGEPCSGCHDCDPSRYPAPPQPDAVSPAPAEVAYCAKCGSVMVEGAKLGRCLFCGGAAGGVR